MKLALFFFLSLAIHGAALLIPVSLNGRANERVIAVTIVPTTSAGDGNENRLAPERGDGRRVLGKADTTEQVTESIRASNATTPAVTEAIAAASPANIIGKASDTNIALASLHVTGETTAPGGRSGGAGIGSSGASVGAAMSVGLGTGGGDITRTPISLRYAPMPRYPERARQKGGKEGKVLLRVVVDIEGHTKAVDIMASSGDETLDQVARDTVKSWRFGPARYGNQPVEGWVDVPIVFRLSDANN